MKKRILKIFMAVIDDKIKDYTRFRNHFELKNDQFLRYQAKINTLNDLKEELTMKFT